MCPPPRRHRRYLPALLLVAIATVAGATSPAPAAQNPAEKPSAASTRARLDAVRAEIAKIVSQQRAATARRGTINAKLAAQARQLDQAARAVHETDAAIAAQTEALADLQRQRVAVQTRLAGQRAALADLLRAAYALDHGPNVSLLLGDDDIARIDRALAYSRYFQRERISHIDTLLAQTAKLDQIGTSINVKTAALQQQRQQRVMLTDQLDQARNAQQKLLAQVNARLAQQQDKLASLHQDADTLTRLLKRLQNVFADIPAKVGKHTPFAKLRGKLAPPAAGTSHEGTGTLLHGIVIAASTGAEVRAVAYGRVAWANFMRGYGILVIIDHGDGWMSLYGGNEAALVSAGDWVRPGQPIATVGRNPEQGGAWFGLRHDGKPVDPQGWFAPQR